MNREYQYIRPILTSPGGGNRRVVQTCRPAPLYRLIWTVPVCDQGDKRGLPKQVGGRDVCDQGEALSRIKALKKRGNALEGPGKLRALQDRLSLSPLRPFAERSRRHLCESTEMARTLTDEIHALSESIDALSQTLTTANRAVLVKDLEGLLRKREVLLRDLISLYFPEFLVLSCGQVGEGGLTREQIQFQNEELGRLKKSCVSALLKAYNGAYARREEGKKVPLFELCQVLVLQATHGQGPHKMAPMERLKRLEKACRSFGSSSGYPSDRYLGHSKKKKNCY